MDPRLALFDPLFLKVCKVGLVPMPGDPRAFRRLARLTRVTALVCGCLCILRNGSPEGPGFSTHEFEIIIVCLHFWAFAASYCTNKALKSHAVDVMLSRR